LNLIGKVLGRDRLVEELGRGGMGMVFRSEHLDDGSARAVKVLPPELAENAVLAERFEREAQALSALRHPNVVAVRDTGRTDGLLWIAMELCAGGSLRARLRSRPGPQDWRFALTVCEEIARGLGCAHERGIAHRDVKPENILFDAKGMAKVADFGLAKILDGVIRTSAGSMELVQSLGVDGPAPSSVPSTGAGIASDPGRGQSLTREGSLLGTLEYMSPEQRRGEAVDASTDVYSLGIVLFELLAGRPPSGIELPRDVNPRSPAPLDELVKRMIAPRDRRIATTALLLVEVQKTAKLVESGARVKPAPAPAARAPVPAGGWRATIFVMSFTVFVFVAALYLMFGLSPGPSRSADLSRVYGDVTPPRVDPVADLEERRRLFGPDEVVAAPPPATEAAVVSKTPSVAPRPSYGGLSDKSLKLGMALQAQDRAKELAKGKKWDAAHAAFREAMADARAGEDSATRDVLLHQIEVDELDARRDAVRDRLPGHSDSKVLLQAVQGKDETPSDGLLDEDGWPLGTVLLRPRDVEAGGARAYELELDGKLVLRFGSGAPTYMEQRGECGLTARVVEMDRSADDKHVVRLRVLVFASRLAK
jgi:serine/threonine protein kinase